MRRSCRYDASGVSDAPTNYTDPSGKDIAIVVLGSGDVHSGVGLDLWIKLPLGPDPEDDQYFHVGRIQVDYGGKDWKGDLTDHRIVTGMPGAFDIVYVPNKLGFKQKNCVPPRSWVRQVAGDEEQDVKSFKKIMEFTGQKEAEFMQKSKDMIVVTKTVSKTNPQDYLLSYSFKDLKGCDIRGLPAQGQWKIYSAGNMNSNAFTAVMISIHSPKFSSRQWAIGAGSPFLTAGHLCDKFDKVVSKGK